MAKIPEAITRKFARVWVCKRCKKKIRADALKVQSKKIPCPRCGQRNFRAKKKERKLAK